jgi:hypothetical protein
LLPTTRAVPKILTPVGSKLQLQVLPKVPEALQLV